MIHPCGRCKNEKYKTTGKQFLSSNKCLLQFSLVKYVDARYFKSISPADMRDNRVKSQHGTVW